MTLRNHGTLVACPTVGQAFVTIFLLEKAVRAQLQAKACNSKLIQGSPEAVDITTQFGTSGTGGAEQAWQAMMRRLERDDTSYQS